MNNHTYGSATHNGEYFDTSRTLRGAKNWATRDEHKEVYIRFNNGYTLALNSTKDKQGRWIDE